nr:polyphosphate polymerase domain-containing protein [[Eubacterium] cellulosolvens]
MTEEQYLRFLETASLLIEPDGAFPHSRILNIYYDTTHHDLVNRSMQKPKYKEKLRLRSYGVPTADSQTFLEIKKKFDGIVYKRRTTLTYAEATDFLSQAPEKGAGHEIPQSIASTQIGRELTYFRDFYRPVPAMVLCYDRDSYMGTFDHSFRLTIDRNIRYRTDELDLTLGDHGRLLDQDSGYLMELKASGAIPLPIVRLLSAYEIYPTSFSKYGRAYTQSQQITFPHRRSPICFQPSSIHQTEHYPSAPRRSVSVPR